MNIHVQFGFNNICSFCDGGHLGFSIGIKNKPLGRLEPNLAGMFLGWSSTKLLFFVPVGYSIWLPGPIICSDWLKFQRSYIPMIIPLQFEFSQFISFREEDL
jgi:hypothetical protein